MYHCIITDSFIMSNVNTPEFILRRFYSGTYTHNNSTLCIACENACNEKISEEDKLRKIKTIIVEYHKHLLVA